MQILLKLCLANIEQASNDFPQEKKKKKPSNRKQVSNHDMTSTKIMPKRIQFQTSNVNMTAIQFILV
jgi:hypothetical protein